MKQYLDLLQAIKDNGTYKPAARVGMPGTKSLFGYQFRHNLANGFPLLTTKKMYWKGVVIELLWFLRGNTNIKFLVDNGVNIWNEDAYNYYLKKCEERLHPPMSFSEFMDCIVRDTMGGRELFDKYVLGDCGYQYGKVWRNWCGESYTVDAGDNGQRFHTGIDQIKNLINGLKNNPESRRHIVTAIDPTHDTDLALYWCHAMFQFNCRPLSFEDKVNWVMMHGDVEKGDIGERVHGEDVPKYYLDCQLYQRSADVFLGVPFNIASYALLTEILAKMCGMVPGEYIHTFGDVHIYENHMDAVGEQLGRTPDNLPELSFGCDFSNLDEFLGKFVWGDAKLTGYYPQESIKGKLSTGLK